MTLERQVEELVRNLQESKLAERLKKSFNKWDKWEMFDEEREKLKEKLDSFEKEADVAISANKSVLDEEEYQVTANNAIEIVLICIMAGIEDYEMLENYYNLTSALSQVKGELHETAKKIADFLEGELEEQDGFEGSFSEYNEEDFLEAFF